MTEHPDFRTISLTRPPVAVQILAIVGFTGFAIPVSIIAMDQFGVLGIALAGFFAFQWTRLAGLGSNARLEEAVELLKPHVKEKKKKGKSSGNASFDAYRNELLDRLEQEQHSFEGFLERLRDAKDKGEFDRFMVEREKNARQKQDTVPA